MSATNAASLYVGDLGKDVTENMIWELFTKVGTLVNVRLCRDSITQESLGYAYVNMTNVQDAERALDTLNFFEINGKPIRIMWSQRDPSLRRTGAGNVFVSNLAPSVDNKGLYDTFSVFGNILSCKVATDEKGVSKGYGYVHFETGEAAQDAIQKFDGTLVDEQEVRVQLFVKKSDRTSQQTWTNLYVKQFPLTWDEQKLADVFGVFGAIANAVITRDETGRSKGFGFVNMADHEGAQKAVNELNNKEVDEAGIKYSLYVSRAQKKTERVRELKNRRDQQNAERVSKYQGMNLYVKNIADTITDEQFKEVFAPYGNITSAKIMRDEAKNSRGFGFVCFATPEEASKAVSAVNTKTVGGKPLVVTFYQRKEARRAQLAANYAPNMRFPPNAGLPMPFMNMYMSQGQQPPRGGAPNFAYGNIPRGPMQGAPRGPGGYPPRQQAGYFPQAMPPQYMNQMGGARPPRQAFPGVPQGMPANFPQGQAMPRGMPRGPMPGQMPQQMPRGAPFPNMQQMPRGMYPAMPMPPQQGGIMPPRANNPNVKFTNQARNQNGQVGMMPQQMVPHMGGMPVHVQKMDFSEALLATTDPMQQKNMIGERLYPLIHHHNPELAGKITGMLLEMDNGELLNLIESPDALLSKIDEAINVLKMHKEGQHA